MVLLRGALKFDLERVFNENICSLDRNMKQHKHHSLIKSVSLLHIEKKQLK